MENIDKFQNNAINAVLKASFTHMLIFALAGFSVAISFLVQNFHQQGDVLYWITYLTFNVISTLVVSLLMFPIFMFKYFLKYKISIKFIEKEFMFFFISFLFFCGQFLLIYYGVDYLFSIDKDYVNYKINTQEITMLSIGYLFGYLFALKKFIEEIKKDDTNYVSEREAQYILSMINKKKYF